MFNFNLHWLNFNLKVFINYSPEPGNPVFRNETNVSIICLVEVTFSRFPLSDDI